jgi:hypothetical protein
MKKVTMVVEVCVEVPDETETTLLHLNNGLEDFRVEESGKPVKCNVTGFTTVEVYNDFPGYP